MKSNRPTSLNNQKQTAAVLAFSLLLLNSSAVLAQGMEAGQMGAFSPSSALGPDQESMLPPEVVPLDPSVAQKLSQSQQEARAMQAQISTPGAVPGLVNGMPSGYQTAQDARQNLFKSLLGQGNASPMNQYYNQNQSAMMMPGQAAQNGQPAFAPIGQGSSNGTVQQLAAAQTQTLTGGNPTPPPIQNTKFGGPTNATSATASGVASVLTGRGLGGGLGVNNLGGLGMMGVMMTGFGARNGFRL